MKTTTTNSGSIRVRAAVLTLVLIGVSMIAGISSTFYLVHESLVASAEARATGAARQLAALIAAPLPGRIAEVQRVVDHESVRAVLANPSPQTQTAAQARLRSVITNAQQQQTLELWSASGNRVVAIEVPPSGGSVRLSQQPPKATGILPYSVDNGHVISEVVVPVRDGGESAKIIGYLLSRRLATNANSNATINQLIGNGGRMMLGNQSGSVWVDLSKQIEAPPIDVTSPGTQRYRGADGESRIAGIAHVAGTPLAVVVDFPQALMVAPAFALLRQLILFGLLFSAVAVAIVWRFTGRITQPLNQLTGALDAMTEGNYKQRVPADRATEVGRLGAAFNAMADRIEAGLKEVEARARELEEKDRRKAAMMNAALDCIMTMDIDGRVVDCNPAAERVFGFAHDDMLRQNIGGLLLLPEYGRSHSLDAYLTTAKRLSLNQRIEVQAKRQSGELFPAEISLVAIRGTGAEGFAAFVRDLTEQKAGEASLLRGILLEEENRRVSEASRLKSEFLANMSHELRTPLNAIIGFAELLYDGQVTPDMPQFKDFMHDILTSGQHLLQLINDVLDLSKIEAGRLEFHPEDTDLDRVVSDSIGILRTLAAQKQLHVTPSIDASIGTVFVDRARLKQVLYNYLSNAIKFTPQKGRITVRALPEDDDHFRIEVADSGIGISPADQQRLFIEFNQLEAGAAKKHQGTGLGLALTKRLIEAQGGRVGVESTPGQGSTFFAVLPKRATGGTPLAAPRSIASRRAGAPAVLVIEDNAADQEAIVRALVDAGFAVETATSRAQALVKLESQVFDAITLDLILPDANGADVLRDLRSSDRNRDVPVVVITVVAANGAVAGFAVHDILTKPVDASGLIDALSRAGITTASTGTVMIVDDDPGSLRLMGASLTQLGFKSVAFERAVDGLRFSERHAPLAVVLDLQMPEMDGFGFLDHFRRIPSCRNTPVIVWTVKDLTRDDYAKLRSSAQGVVGKGASNAAPVVEELRRFLSPPKAVNQ